MDGRAIIRHNAVERTLEAIEAGDRRILLTLATGTGKTSIAFQIVWKLFESAMEPLAASPTRRPRILFLADRNNLADQAFNDFSSFAAFAEDAFVRIKPDEITKRGRVPKNGSVFFTIFQTFMSGRDANGEPAPNFGEYPQGLFRLHRHRRVPSRRRQRREHSGAAFSNISRPRCKSA